MTMTGIKKWLFVCVAAPTLLAGCTRDDEEQIMQEAQNITADQADMVTEMEKAQSLFFDATEQTSYASGLEEVSGSECFDIQYIEDKGDMRFIVDYGKDGCKDNMGNVRKGLITQINRTTDKGVEMSYKLENYEVNGYSLSGVVNVSSLKRDENNLISYKYKIIDGKVNTPKGKSYLVSRDLNFKQMDNAASVNYKVTGSSSVINSGGVQYSSDLVAPAVYKGACFSEGNFYPMAGVAQVDFEDGKYYTVDFGGGNCDKAAKIKAGTKELALNFK